MGLMRFMFAICVWAMVPFDARGGVRDLEDEAATRIAKRFVALAGSQENAVLHVLERQVREGAANPDAAGADDADSDPRRHD